MEKLDKLFVRWSLIIGMFGLGIALGDLGLSNKAIAGFILVFASIWSVLWAILQVLEAGKK